MSSLAFNQGATTTDYAEALASASLNNLDPITLLCWTYPTGAAFVNAERLFNKGTSTFTWRTTGTGGNWFFNRGRATTNTQYNTSGNPLQLGVWNFVATTFNSGGAAGALMRHYIGFLGAIAAETAYGTKTDGSGALSTDAGSALRIGNDNAVTPASPWFGRIALVHVLTEELTLGQIQAQQFRPHLRASSRLFVRPGWFGAASHPDWSGHGNAVSISGPALADGLPLGPLWPASPFSQDDVWLPPGAGLIAASVAARGSIVPTVAARGSIAVTVRPLESG
jgi:hypothetical protein